MYDKYSSQGLEILAFPCNNFGGQEPGSDAEVLAFAKSKGAEYPVLGKIECDNGASTHPLFQYLMGTVGGGPLGDGLKWNFAKFLCNSEGVPVKRFAPPQSPLNIEQDIRALVLKK